MDFFPAHPAVPCSDFYRDCYAHDEPATPATASPACDVAGLDVACGASRRASVGNCLVCVAEKFGGRCESDADLFCTALAEPADSSQQLWLSLAAEYLQAQPLPNDHVDA